MNDFLDLKDTDPMLLMLASGGDSRLTLDENTGLNVYGCKPTPLDVAHDFSSCTSNNISNETFTVLLEWWKKNAERNLDRNLISLHAVNKARVASLYKLPSSAIISGPSGTDFELLLLALVSQQAGSARISNICAAPEEVGSGIGLALQGRAFSERTPMGASSAQKGKLLSEFANVDVLVENIQLREVDLRPKSWSALVEEYESVIDRALRSSREPIVRIIHSSKTGIVGGGVPLCQLLKLKYGDKIHVVVDACQGRISHEDLKAYRDAGAFVMVTLSKFFGGPPFSGFVVIPSLTEQFLMTKGLTLETLGEYFTRYDFDQGHHLSFLNTDANAVNGGLIMRFFAGLQGLNQWCGDNLCDLRVSQVLEQFNNTARDLCSEFPHFSILENRCFHDGKFTLAQDSIITIMLHRDHRREVKVNYQNAREIFTKLSAVTSNDQRAVRLGQPVKLNDTSGELVGNLRVAAGVRHIRCWALLTTDQLSTMLKHEFRSVFRAVEGCL